MPLTRILSIRQWPAPVLNGASVGLGLAGVTALIGMAAGMPAAITAASGAATASVADTVCAPRAKPWQMLPAVFSTVLVSALVACTHHTPRLQMLVILLTMFVSIFWMSWGKRGGPQTFVMVLTLVFQMAAFRQQSMDGAQVMRHVAWVAGGAVAMAAWSMLSIRVLARRYRTLALADSLDALAATMRAQARWTALHGQQGQAADPQPTEALVALISQQAGIADVFQSARDLLYSHPSPSDAFTQRQLHTLVHIVNLRDVVQACQLDVDRLPDHASSPQALKAVSEHLLLLARRLQDNAHTWRTGRRLPTPTLNTPAWPYTGHPVLASLGRRCQHMRVLADDIAQSIKPAAPRPGAIAASAVAVLTPEQTGVLPTLVSPMDWPWAPLKAQLGLGARSPVLRYALRATLAVACADGIAHVLPWASHPHWILMTVAVVMRGNLEQTLARRDARVQGTLLGCLIASALLTLDTRMNAYTGGHSAWLFLALIVSLSLAHGFVLINYRVTAAAGAVLALVQGHLFSPSQHPALLDAAERLGDTLIGAALAWAFSYVLPSWERQQLPRLVQRLMQAQMHYTHHALRWHLNHARTPRRSLARREIYDVLWLLSQSLQRMGKEPRHARAWAPSLEAVLVHSNRLVSHLAAVKGLLSVRHRDMDARIVEPALLEAEAEVLRLLATDGTDGPGPEEPSASSPGSPAATQDSGADDHAGDAELPADGHLNDWLLTRLHQTAQEARLLSLAARQLQAHDNAPTGRNTL